jgi:hypothetical protein
MPIQLITNDHLGIAPDNKDMSYKLMKAATLQLHEKGLVVAVVPPIVMREMHHIARNRTNAVRDSRDPVVAAIPDAARRTRATKRLHYAKLIRQSLFDSQTNANNQHNICNTTLSPDFFADVIRNGDNRSDMRLYLGLHYSRKVPARSSTTASPPCPPGKHSPPYDVTLETTPNFECSPTALPNPVPNHTF